MAVSCLKYDRKVGNRLEIYDLLIMNKASVARHHTLSQSRNNRRDIRGTVEEK